MIDAALGFFSGLPRTAAIRHAAWDAFRAFADLREANPAAGFAARSASAAAAAAFLHPLAHASQTRHLLGSATYAVGARECDADGAVDTSFLIETFASTATGQLRAILRRFPALDQVSNNRMRVIMAALDRELRNFTG